MRWSPGLFTGLWGPFPPNEVGRIAQHISKEEGKKEWVGEDRTSHDWEDCEAMGCVSQGRPEGSDKYFLIQSKTSCVRWVIGSFIITDTVINGDEWIQVCGMHNFLSIIFNNMAILNLHPTARSVLQFLKLTNWSDPINLDVTRQLKVYYEPKKPTMNIVFHDSDTVYGKWRANI